LFDGIVSMLRIYDPRELRELVEKTSGNETFEWDIGILPVRGSPLGLTYLIGMPSEPTDVSPVSQSGGFAMRALAAG
ncbi:MAG: hypothetical protein C5B46_07655, partial [Proteobacteria bacterium]